MKLVMGRNEKGLAKGKRPCRCATRDGHRHGCRGSPGPPHYAHFPHRDLPPPEPPDGRHDLWELHFCRWWGWNWVRKDANSTETQYQVNEKSDFNGVRSASKTSDTMAPNTVGMGEMQQYPVAEKSNSIPDSQSHKSERFSDVNRVKYCNSESGAKCQKKCGGKDPPDTSQELYRPGRKKSRQGRRPTRKQQFKAMCRCLLGKKKTPCETAQLYNTPSGSTVGVDLAVQYSDKGSHPDIRGSYSVNRVSHQSYPGSIPEVESTRGSLCAPKCGHSGCPTSSVVTHKESLHQESQLPKKMHQESIHKESQLTTKKMRQKERRHSSRCSQVEASDSADKNDVSSLESASCNEYVTIRLFHGSNNECICVPSVPVAPPRRDTHTSVQEVCTEEVCPEVKKVYQPTCDSKQTQTSRIILEADKAVEACPDTCGKLLKFNKKHKTINITLCCCPQCKGGNTGSDLIDRCAKAIPGCGVKIEAACQVGCKALPKQCCTKESYLSLEPEKEDSKQSYDAKMAALPITAEPIDISKLQYDKKLTKFGRPFYRNYPWMQDSSKGDPWMGLTESTGTTTSFDNEHRPEIPLHDSYDWLNPDFDRSKRNQHVKFPKFMGFTNDVSYLTRLDMSRKSDEEERVILDAVCDAIMQDHDDKACDISSDLESIKECKDLGIVCNLHDEKRGKTDVYTGFSRALIKTEDVGVQLSDLQKILESSDFTRLDTVMNSIMDNLFSESRENIRNITRNIQHSKINQPNSREGHKNASRNLAPEFTFVPKETGCTKTGLIPVNAKPRFAKATKRVVSPRDDTKTNKKFKQGEEKLGKTGKNAEKIENLFSKIDDMVQKSKHKTAEMQKVLGLVPDKALASKEIDDIVLQSRIKSAEIQRILDSVPRRPPSPPSSQQLSQNSVKDDSDENSSDEDTPKYSSKTRKRSYRMSSDNFKGSITENLSPNFKDSDTLKKSINTFSNETSRSYCDIQNGQADSQEEEYNAKLDTLKPRAGIEQRTLRVFPVSTSNAMKVSNLSAQSFMVCDEKSTVSLLQSPKVSEARVLKKYSNKKPRKIASQIPIRIHTNE